MRDSVLVLLALLLAGCADPGVTPTQQAAQAPAPAATAAEGAPASASGPSTPAAALALEGEGLRAFILPSGSARPIPFGTGKADTLRMLEAVLGGPPTGGGENIDCGATHARWPDGLTVWFVGDRFSGWAVESEDAAVSTASGLKVGSTRADLENGGSVVEIAPSSLGVEFTAGGVAGLLESPDADARVTHLWAGAVCLAR